MMMHGIDWDGHNVDGWLASEKFDGCRAFWTGEKLLTKSGREYRNVPTSLIEELHDLDELALDCELCVRHVPRRISLTAACRAALQGLWGDDLVLVAFDLPTHGGNAATRDAYLRGMFSMHQSHRVRRAERWVIDTASDAAKSRDWCIQHGGEGIMLLRPDSFYTPGRRDCLLKMK